MWIKTYVFSLPWFFFSTVQFFCRISSVCYYYLDQYIFSPPQPHLSFLYFLFLCSLPSAIYTNILPLSAAAFLFWRKGSFHSLWKYLVLLYTCNPSALTQSFLSLTMEGCFLPKMEVISTLLILGLRKSWFYTKHRHSDFVHPCLSISYYWKILRGSKSLSHPLSLSCFVNILDL